MKFDIYLSCRKDGGEKYALKLKEALNKSGFTLFYNSQQDEDFNERTLEVIKGSRLFIPLILEGALDKCVNRDDYIRGEIEYAISTNIPFLVTKMDFADDNLTLPNSLIGGDRLGDKLIAKGSRRLNIDCFFDHNVANYISRGVLPLIDKGRVVDIITNSNCDIYCNDYYLATLKEGISSKFTLSDKATEVVFKGDDIVGGGAVAIIDPKEYEGQAETVIKINFNKESTEPKPKKGSKLKERVNKMRRELGLEEI